MSELALYPLYGFLQYPSVGEDDWSYAFSTARVRALESTFIKHNTFVDMINSADFKSACENLAGSEYSFVTSAKNFVEIRDGLIEKRSEVRALFAELIMCDDHCELLRARADFANLRLALRRLVLSKPLGVDYSDEGHVAEDKFEEVLEQENYIEFPIFMQEAVEAAVLQYYANKDIREIDSAIDAVQKKYTLEKAIEIDSVFLTELFRMRIDLDNIMTMLRLKFRESNERSFFFEGGYLDETMLVHGIDVGYESVAAIFAGTPYFHIVDVGANYLAREGSFLKLEEQCSSHILGYLKCTDMITAGPQPIVAYLLKKENEIKMVRMILTGKKNGLDGSMLLDRLNHAEL
jgi:V/A-type H+/Na+-transporting ATPase subunit C